MMMMMQIPWKVLVTLIASALLYIGGNRSSDP